jgi:polyhydroxyalkanoate synthesis regulator phasin
MLDLARRAILTGVGLGLVAKDKIDEVIGKISEENNLTEEESRKLARELLDQSEDARRKLSDLTRKTTQDLLVRLDVPSQKRIVDLEKRVKKLEESVSRDREDVS